MADHDSPKLTPRQQEIFELIQRAIATTGAPPTRAEIAAQLGFRSANAAEEHLQALARKGVIELVGGTSRGIRLKAGTLRGLHDGRRSPSRGMTARGLADTDSLALPGLEQLVLPLVGRVAAGHPILAQEHIEQSYAVEPSLFARKPDYLLRVKGMSMRDAGILDGDLLAVARTAKRAMGRSWWRALATKSPSSAFSVAAPPSPSCPRTPISNPSRCTPMASISNSKAWLWA